MSTSKGQLQFNKPLNFKNSCANIHTLNFQKSLKIGTDNVKNLKEKMNKSASGKNVRTSTKSTVLIKLEILEDYHGNSPINSAQPSSDEESKLTLENDQEPSSPTSQNSSNNNSIRILLGSNPNEKRIRYQQLNDSVSLLVVPNELNIFNQEDVEYYIEQLQQEDPSIVCFFYCFYYYSFYYCHFYAKIQFLFGCCLGIECDV